MAIKLASLALFCLNILSVTCTSSAIVVEDDITLRSTPLFKNFDLGEWGHFQFEDGDIDFELECPLSATYPGGQSMDFYLTIELANENMTVANTSSYPNCQMVSSMDQSQRMEEGIHLMTVAKVLPKSLRYLLSLSVDEGMLLRVLLQVCPKNIFSVLNQRPKTCKGTLTLTNSNYKNHLSSDVQWIHHTYQVMLLLWLVIFVSWHYNWIQFRKFSNGLHKLITFVPNLKIIHIIFVWYFWDQQETEGTTSQKVVVFVEVLAILSSSGTLTITALASMGWCIMSPTIDSRWCVGNTLPAVLVFHIAISCALAFSNSSMPQVILWGIWLMAFTFFSLMCWFMIRCNQRIIQRQAVCHDPKINPLELVFHTDTRRKQLMMKFNLFSKIKLAVFFYFASGIAIQVLWLLFLHEYYISLLKEIQQILMFVIFMIIFHLEDFSEYEVVSFMPPRDMCMVLLPYADVRRLTESKLAVGMMVSPARSRDCKPCEDVEKGKGHSNPTSV